MPEGVGPAVNIGRRFQPSIAVRPIIFIGINQRTYNISAIHLFISDRKPLEI